MNQTENGPQPLKLWHLSPKLFCGVLSAHLFKISRFSLTGYSAKMEI